MTDPYQACLLIMNFKKEEVTMCRPYLRNQIPMLGEKINILPGLKREVIDLIQEEIGDYTVTHIELEPETQGRLKSDLLMLGNFTLHPMEMWGVLPKLNKSLKRNTPKIPRKPEEVSIQ
jgi:hypothetical protein